jgi:hypothetical protein
MIGLGLSGAVDIDAASVFEHHPTGDVKAFAVLDIGNNLLERCLTLKIAAASSDRRRRDKAYRERPGRSCLSATSVHLHVRVGGAAVHRRNDVSPSMIANRALTCQVPSVGRNYSETVLYGHAKDEETAGRDTGQDNFASHLEY